MSASRRRVLSCSCGAHSPSTRPADAASLAASDRYTPVAVVADDDAGDDSGDEVVTLDVDCLSTPGALVEMGGVKGAGVEADDTAALLGSRGEDANGVT